MIEFIQYANINSIICYVLQQFATYSFCNNMQFALQQFASICINLVQFPGKFSWILSKKIMKAKKKENVEYFM
jgi:hypothetical protein